MPPAYRGSPDPVSVPNLWLVIYTSVTAAILTASAIMFLCGVLFLGYLMNEGKRILEKEQQRALEKERQKQSR